MLLLRHAYLEGAAGLVSILDGLVKLLEDGQVGLVEFGRPVKSSAVGGNRAIG